MKQSFNQKLRSFLSIVVLLACVLQPKYLVSAAAATRTPKPTATAIPTATSLSNTTAKIVKGGKLAATATIVPTSTLPPTATAVPTFVPTSTVVPTETDTPTPTATFVPTETETPVPTATFVPTSTVVPTETNTPAPTATFVPTSTAAPTETETPAPTTTFIPTSTLPPTATETVTPTITFVPTVLPTVTATPTEAPELFATSQPVDPANLLLTNTFNLKVSKTGIYRITYEMLRDAGLDLAGIPISEITIVNRAQSIPVYVYTENQAQNFGLGSFIEFYGEALNTLYTDTNIYTVQVSKGQVSHIPTLSAQPDTQLTHPTSYTETLTVDSQLKYANYAPGDDPWYNTSMQVTTTAKSWNFIFQLSSLVDAPAVLEATVWGGTDLSANPDHHLVINLNGADVADQKFDGLTLQKIKIEIPQGILHEGSNTLQFKLPADLGISSDIVLLDKYSIHYQRTFNAQDNHLTFTTSGDILTVNNLSNPNVVVYVIRNGGLMRLENIQVLPNGPTFTAAFAGTNQPDTYVVTTTEAIYTPVIEATRSKADLNRPAQYLIISHPDFIDGLQPLIQAHEAQGLTVNVVDVRDLYAQYTYGVFDPLAIKQYIGYAGTNLGTQYVLLVGGDNYDYHNYTGANVPSFIPSLYAPVGPNINFAPVDPLYADWDGDNIPNLAIGRFPVRTTNELNLIVNKTIAYSNKNYGRTAAFAADYFDGLNYFKGLSQSLMYSLPADWQTESMYLDDLGAATAKNNLLTAMNRGTALINFNGHSSPTAWANNKLFTTADAVNLTNVGKPFVALQWGCWNTYNVDPLNNNLTNKFLFSGENGAVAVMGGTTLIYFESELRLSEPLLPRLVTPGMTIGQALLEAKTALAQNYPGITDIQLGWTLMGDPALVIEP